MISFAEVPTKIFKKWQYSLKIFQILAHNRLDINKVKSACLDDDTEK